MKDEAIKDGDLLVRAMPNLSEDDVAELMRSVEPLLAEDEHIREWCSKGETKKNKNAHFFYTYAACTTVFIPSIPIFFVFFQKGAIGVSFVITSLDPAREPWKTSGVSCARTEVT